MSGFPLQPPIDARLTAPLELPATSTGHLTTEGGSTLDDGSGDATIAGTLGVDGATTLSSTLAVTDGVTLDSTLGVTGAATLDSTLAVTGDTTLSGTLGVTGNTTLDTAIISNYQSTNTNFGAVTVPASGTALPAQANSGFFYIVGGAITGITINGVAIDDTQTLIYVRPGDSIVIDYTTAPAVYKQNL